MAEINYMQLFSWTLPSPNNTQIPSSGIFHSRRKQSNMDLDIKSSTYTVSISWEQSAILFF